MSSEAEKNSIYHPEPIVSTPHAEVDLINPQPDQIVVVDIALSLTRKGRYTDLSQSPIKVAQHLLLCDWIAEQIDPDMDPVKRLAILLHDAHEYVLGDWNRPLKRYINAAGDNVLVQLERGLDRAIATAVGMPADVFEDHEVHKVVKFVDNLALAIEVEAVFPVVKERWGFLPDIWDEKYTGIDEEMMEKAVATLRQGADGNQLYALFIQAVSTRISKMVAAMRAELDAKKPVKQPAKPTGAPPKSRRQSQTKH